MTDYNEPLEMVNSELYALSGSENKVEVIFQSDNAWVTQKGMAELYNIDVSGITKHLTNIFDTKELVENSNVQFLHIAKSSKPVKYYSLDALISVGYRVNSQEAIQFRIWATGVIKQYIRDGYVINEMALRDDPAKLNKLAAKIREIRANEKNVFSAVRECFKISASDYEPSSDEVRLFFALLQDKFHHAITSMTASKILMDRADAFSENMGLVNFADLLPTKQEAKTGKNYLTENELYRMFLLSEQFLLFAESSALMGKELTMVKLHNQLDNLLQLNGYPVFDGYKDFIKKEAIQHAELEYSRFIELKKLEMLEVTVDQIDYDSGSYQEYKEEMGKISMVKLKQHLKIQEVNLIENNKSASIGLSTD
jgi:hypothetical protein